MSNERRQIFIDRGVGFLADFIKRVPQPQTILDELNRDAIHLFRKSGERPNLRHARAIQNFIFGIRLGDELNQLGDEYPNLVMFSDPTYTLASQTEVGIILNIAKVIEKTKGGGNWIEELKNGEYIYKGSIDNYFILAGLEEASHVKYDEKEPNYSGLHPSQTPLAEYDSQPHELLALQQKLEIAGRLMMDRDTVDVLKVRLENARRFLSS